MDIIVFVAVMAAAVLHASWNVLLKNGIDKNTSMAAVVFGHMPIAVILLLFVPWPVFESWPYILAGALLHIGYQIFLKNAYHIGDLSQVYPIARGTAPLIVTVISLVFLGEELNQLELLGVVVIALGLFSLSLVRKSDGERNLKVTILAVITGCFIAGYSIVDGLGARLAGSFLGFYSVLSLLNGVGYALYIRHSSPGVIRRVFTHGKTVMLFGGGASFLAYALVIWAFTHAPIALVTALRETSIVFALMLGVFFLKEKLNLVKLLSTFITLSGAVLLKISK